MSTTLVNKVQEYSLTATQTARDELIVNHLWLVRHLIGKMAARLPPGVDVENLESAGVLGLVEAANRFDVGRGVDFKAFAALRIRGAIIDEARRNSPLPQEVMQHVSMLARAQETLHSPMSIDDLASTTGLTNDQVLDALGAIPLMQVKSLEETGDDPRPGSQSPPDSAAERSEQKELLADAIAALPERERLVVTMYYREDLRLKEIGQLLNLSESRVSRLLTAAQFQLREYISSHS